MSLEYFEGPAGCGKTYQLVEALRAFLNDRPLEEGEAVLGLTYMHGSRRRMHGRLTQIEAHRGRLLVCTVDSLARQVVCRWRTLARDIEPQLDLRAAPDFASICRVAAVLMGKDCVSGWLRVRYPVVVTDELQDCKGDHLCMIQALESCCHVIAAADEFQDLRSTGANAAVEWLHQGSGKRNTLTGNRRTTQHVLLAAAQRLRSSHDCGEVLKSNLSQALNANVGAGGAARALYYNGLRNAVILTPTGPDKSRFVREVTARLMLKTITPAGVNKPVGPFRIIWESNVEDERAALLSALGTPSECTSLDGLAQTCSGKQGALQDLYSWAEKKYRVRGQSLFSAPELASAIDRILQSRRAFLPASSTGTIRAMTINQAKNREFDGVIILWPFEVGGDLDSQRRRLYNALTRAQKWAVVIVQDDPKKSSRLSVAPFSKPAKLEPKARNGVSARAIKLFKEVGTRVNRLVLSAPTSP